MFWPASTKSVFPYPPAIFLIFLSASPDNSFDGFLFFLSIRAEDGAKTRKEKVVNNLNDAHEAEAEVEAHETTCIANKGGYCDVNITLVVSVVGVLDEELDDCYILQGIGVNKIVHVFCNFFFGWINWIVNAAHFFKLYQAPYSITYISNISLLLN